MILRLKVNKKPSGHEQSCGNGSQKQNAMLMVVGPFLKYG